MLLFKIFLTFIVFPSDVLPVHQASHQYVGEQRQQQYDDLHEALEAMCKIDETSPLHEVHLKMFLVENGLLPFNQSGMVSYPL